MACFTVSKVYKQFGERPLLASADTALASSACILRINALAASSSLRVAINRSSSDRRNSSIGGSNLPERKRIALGDTGRDVALGCLVSYDDTDQGFLLGSISW